MLNLAKGVSPGIVSVVAGIGLLLGTSVTVAQQPLLTNYVMPSADTGLQWGQPDIGHCAFCGSGKCGHGAYCGRTGQCQNCSGQHCHGHPGFLGSWAHKHRSYYLWQPALPCPGEAIGQSLEAQKLNGRVAQLVLHHFHFTFDPASQTVALTRSGWYRVYDLSRILPTTPGAIAVDPSNNSEMDAMRVQLVRDALAGYGLSEVDVILARPIVPGLAGAEALGIYDQRQLGSPIANLRGQSTIGQGSNTGSPSDSGSPPGGSPNPR